MKSKVLKIPNATWQFIKQGKKGYLLTVFHEVFLIISIKSFKIKVFQIIFTKVMFYVVIGAIQHISIVYREISVLPCGDMKNINL